MILNFQKPTVYVDSDGVVADFEAYYEEAFKHRHDSVADAEMWKNINAHGQFFANLPAMNGAIEGIKKIQQTHDVVILTACPKSDYQRAAEQKKAWFKAIDPNLIVLPVLGGKNKYLFMQKPGDVLIDDFDKNIEPWNAAGGFGIVHKNWNDTAAILEKYLFG